MFFKKLGIDLGTANSLVYLEGQGIVLNEPTVVAVSLRDKKVLAVGKEAKEMLGRTPDTIFASKPMKEGVIANYKITEAMLHFFLRKICGRSFLFKPEVMICVPAGCTQVEKRAVETAALSAGCRKVYLIHESLAAAIGAGIPIAEASGNMILDMGGGAAEAAVISLGTVVVSHSIRVAGSKIDDAIANYIRKKQGLIIGENSAENIKIKIGSALKLKREANKKMMVKGRDNISGLPRKIEITSNEVTEAIEPVLNQISGMVKKVLSEVQPELAADIIDKGIVMSGGTALLSHFDKFLTRQTGVPCFKTEEPILCVVKGTGIALENLDAYKRSMVKA
ncbi:MAG TPA: rod shape-determining protein [Candidatus Bathyarchaeia archaeon]|nr:rod shape-determining protein [Candidatus Bathyarchaeia archaeon]